MFAARGRMVRATGVVLLGALASAACGTRLEDERLYAAAHGPGGSSRAASVDAGEGTGLGRAPGALPTRPEGGTGNDVESGSPGGEASASAAPRVREAGTGAAPGTKSPRRGAAPARADQPAGARARGEQEATPHGPAPEKTPVPGNPATPGEPEPPIATGRPPIILGHIGDYSGVIGTIMNGGDVMAQVMARYINDQGGLNGHPVQVITADAGGDPSRALALTRDLVENEGAIALFGNMWVLSGPGPRDYLEEHQIPLVGGDSTTLVWFQSPMYFPTGSSMPILGRGAVQGLIDRGHERLGVLYCVEAEQCKVFRDSAVNDGPRLGAEIVYEAQVSLAQPDFTAECLQANRNGAEALIVGLDSPSITRLTRACSQQGYEPQIMTASLAIIPKVAEDPNMEGLMAPLSTFPWMIDNIPGAREYPAALQRYAPKLQRSPVTSSVWTAGVLLQKISRNLPPGEITPAHLLAGLYTIENDDLGGLVGPLTFHEGKPADEVTCVFYTRLEGGRFTAPNGSTPTCF